MFGRSVIVHSVLPGGDCNDAVPVVAPELSTLASTRRSGALCVNSTVEPLIATVPTPVKTEPLQQNWYWPVVELNSSTIAGFASSCKHSLKTVTENEQVAVLPEVSVAVQVTVVVPMGTVDPEGGLQTVVTPG